MAILKSLKINLLNTVRDPMTFFWNTFFPIILASFFCMVLPNIGKDFNKVDIGVNKNNPHIQILKSIDMLNIKEVEEDVAKDLKNKKYKVFVENDLSLKVNSSDSTTMVVKSIVDQIKQMNETKIDQREILKNINKQFVDYKNQKQATVETILFSIIIMTSLYTMFDGVYYLDLLSRGSSDLAVRLLISPLKKSLYLINGIISSLIVSGFNTVLLILYLKFVFGINLITNYLASALMITLIMVFGITLGMLLSVTLKAKTQTKCMIGLGIILFMNHTSGMLGSDPTNVMLSAFPIIKKINPALYMENALTATNMLKNNSYIMPMVVFVLGLSAVLFSFSLFRLRRFKQNDF